MNQKKSTVAVVACPNYEPHNVQQAVRRGLDLLGGTASLFSDHQKRLLLKPNALSAKTPEKCVTTHPEVFRAVAEALAQSSFELSYGDSPAVGKVENVMKKIGIKAIADALAIPLADFENSKTISYPEGRRIKQFKLANAVLGCDAIINLPKLKTHGLTRMTGAIKNLFGCITGFSKPEFHVKLPDAEHFSEMLVDLSEYLKPQLCILDAIQSMEGNGPGNGTSVNTGVLLFSTDPVAVDSLASLIMNIPPERVLTNRIGAARGLGNCDIDAIEVLGDNWQDFVIKKFDIHRGPQIKSGSRWKYSLVRRFLTSKPVIDDETCTRCNLCVQQCPVSPKALSWQTSEHKDPPLYDYSLCIRCYCCQEICPHGAISVQTPLARKIFDAVYPF